MARWRPQDPTNCLGAYPDRRDGCIYLRFKQFPLTCPDARMGYEALQLIHYEGGYEWNSHRAPYCKLKKQFLHKLSGNWTRGEFPFLQQYWQRGCEDPRRKRRTNKPDVLGGRSKIR